MTPHIKIKRNPIRKWIIVGAIIAAIIIIGLFLKPVFLSWTAGIQNYFLQKGDQTSSFFSRLFLSGRIAKENESLKKQNQDLLFKISQLENAKKENEELRKVLNLNFPKEYAFTDAYIFAKDAQTDSAFINKGETDGIKVGAVIVNSEKMLLGKVSEVFKNNSLITLITSSQIKTNLEIGDNRIEGIGKGKGNFQMEITNLPKDQPIKAGDLVITGTIQNEFPAGLPVGTIKEVKITDLDPFQSATINPFFNLNTLGFVLVISNF